MPLQWSKNLPWKGHHLYPLRWPGTVQFFTIMNDSISAPPERAQTIPARLFLVEWTQDGTV